MWARIKGKWAAMRAQGPYFLYLFGHMVAQRVPPSIGSSAARILGIAALLITGSRRRQVQRNLRRICRPMTRLSLWRMMARTYANYGQYWYELFRTGAGGNKTSGHFQIDNLHYLEGAYSQSGAIVVLPHLGNFEAAAMYFCELGYDIVVVAEVLEPPALFDWFVSQRTGYGLEVVPLDKFAAPKLIKALKQGKLVGLLADRDIAGASVEVDFFGETTKVPAGPAAIAARAKVPVIPIGVFFQEEGYRVEVTEPITPITSVKQVQEVMQTVIRRFEGFIKQAPDQWLVMQPQWPSDEPKDS